MSPVRPRARGSPGSTGCARSPRVDGAELPRRAVQPVRLRRPARRRAVGAQGRGGRLLRDLRHGAVPAVRARHPRPRSGCRTGAATPGRRAVRILPAYWIALHRGRARSVRRRRPRPRPLALLRSIADIQRRHAVQRSGGRLEPVRRGELLRAAAAVCRSRPARPAGRARAPDCARSSCRSRSPASRRSSCGARSPARSPRRSGLGDHAVGGAPRLSRLVRDRHGIGRARCRMGGRAAAPVRMLVALAGRPGWCAGLALLARSASVSPRRTGTCSCRGTASSPTSPSASASGLFVLAAIGPGSAGAASRS